MFLLLQISHINHFIIIAEYSLDCSSGDVSKDELVMAIALLNEVTPNPEDRINLVGGIIRSDGMCLHT